MNSKFQAIIATPAMVVPAMTTEEIKTTLLEASVEYIKKRINLETLSLIVFKIQGFMGMRGEDEAQIIKILNEMIDFAEHDGQKQTPTIFIEAMAVNPAVDAPVSAFLVNTQ